MACGSSFEAGAVGQLGTARHVALLWRSGASTGLVTSPQGVAFVRLLREQLSSAYLLLVGGVRPPTAARGTSAPAPAAPAARVEERGAQILSS
jgi:hypothetical protein